MNWIETPDSSNIARFRYDGDSNILEIEFQKGGLYQYFDVPVAVFEQMKAASSTGQYFAQNIKGVFRYARG
jgi:YD repeat-containing protein